jgi:hypothetical protein
MGGSSVAFGIQDLVRGVVALGEDFIAKDTGKIGLGIFLLIFVFHLIEGATELVDAPSSCRLFRGRFWLRILMVGALLGGYRTVFVGTVGALQGKFMTAFTGKWVEVWERETTALQEIRKAEQENRALNFTEVAATKGGKDDDSWYAKLGRYVVDGLLTGVGWVLAVVAGLVITLLILMEGFWTLGINMLLVAVGPICVAFLAHEKTEGIFWSFAKSFLVYGLLYMPMLGLGAAFAGEVMARMTTMVTASGVVYGDGSDIAVHLIMVVLGPLCAYAVVRAVPGLVSALIGSSVGGGGAGGAFGTAMAVIGSLVAGAAGAGGAGAGGARAAPEPTRRLETGGEDAAAGNVAGVVGGSALGTSAEDVRGEP